MKRMEKHKENYDYTNNVILKYVIKEVWANIEKKKN